MALNLPTDPQTWSKEDYADRYLYRRNKVEQCRANLDRIRHAPLEDASALNSNGQGALRFQKMGQLTQELITAEAEYRTFRAQALDADAISERLQSSNFGDHKDDGYGAQSLLIQGHPMRLPKATRVQGWAETIPSDGDQGVIARNVPGSPKQRDTASNGN